MLYVQNILLNLARKEIQQRKNKLQFTRERVIVSVKAHVMFQLIKWTREKGRGEGKVIFHGAEPETTVNV